MDDQEYAELREQHAYHRTESDKLWKRICAEETRRASLKWEEHFKDGITIERVMSINWDEVDRLPKNSEWHNKITRFVGSFPGVHYEGRYYTCKDPYEGQVALSVVFDQNKPFDAQLGILEFVPFMKNPILNDKVVEDHKRISVFEHTLSEYGVYDITIDANEVAKVIKTTHGRESELFSGSLMDVLKYIYNKHPYKRFGHDDD